MEQVISSAVPEAIPVRATNLPDNLSPQCIGREFVRCYYTLLHDNPDKLHRFYLDQSAFVHGNQTEETAECVSGQRAIHEKIMSLNFIDCRTKIKHVDSQPTIDNGVVVQVSGELSNAGKLPRRFMQTFVLGSQTPRKYYVHNDIFRYQDEVFGYDQDDAVDDEENSLSSQEDIHEQIDEEPVPQTFDDCFENEKHHEEDTNGNIVEDDVMNSDSEISNEIALENLNDIPLKNEPVSVTEPIIEPRQEDVECPEEDPHFDYNLQPDKEEMCTDITDEKPVEEILHEIVDTIPEVPKGPKSWAMIAGACSSSAPVRVVNTQSTPPKPKNIVQEPKDIPKKETTFQPFNKDTDRSENTRGGRRNKVESREKAFTGNYKDRERFPERERFQEREAPNAHQIFVGNLPNNASYPELEEKFKSFGNVIHVRVTPNNFGFVVFENEGPVQAILNAVRSGEKFFLNDHRLNIEEKKTPMNTNRGPRKPFNDQRGTNRRGGSRRGGAIGRSGFNDHNSELK